MNILRRAYYAMVTAIILSVNISFAQPPNQQAVLEQKLRSVKLDTARIRALLTLGEFCLNKPGEAPIDLSTALKYSKSARNLSFSLKYYSGIGKSILLDSKVYRESGNKDKAMELTKKALQFAIQHNLVKQTADAYLAFCDFYGTDNADLAERIKYTEKALPIYQMGGFKLEEANALKSLGDYYHLQANNPKAIKLIEQSLAVYHAIKYKSVQGVYDLLGYLHARSGNDVLAIKYGLMAVKTAQQVQDTSMQLCTIYNRLAITYNGLKKYNEAYAYYQKALKVALRYNQTDAIQQIKINQIIMFMGIHKPNQSLATLVEVMKKYPAGANTRIRITSLSLFATIYMDMEQMPNAKRYVDSLLYYYNDFGHEFGYAPYVNEPVIKYYFLNKKYNLAYSYLRTNDSLARLRHNLTTLSRNEFMWSKIDSASGKYIPALQHYQQFKGYSDSLKNIDQRKQISGLQYQFDLDNKDRDILVLTQKGQLQENRINSETMLRNAVIAGLVIVMIICGLVYSRYNVKNKSNKLLTLKQTKINAQNEQLLKLLQEKEWLVKEIHHRVKNNLQIVISLLNTQSAYLDNKDAIEAIKNSQHRMQTMSLIHQKLYQSDNLSTIDMASYIRELVEYLNDSFGRDKNITISFEISPIRLDVSQAVPIGLIMNEAVSNAIKYAFKDQQKGNIKVFLKPTGDNGYHMSIEDDGPGLPENFDLFNTSSLGMSLMLGLTQQLDGEFLLENKNGLKVNVSFKILKFDNLEKETA